MTMKKELQNKYIPQLLRFDRKKQEISKTGFFFYYIAMKHTFIFNSYTLQQQEQQEKITG